jgi:hypothetical protein
MRFTGLVSHRNRRMSVAHANRLSRGDLRRNARLDRLRGVVPDHAVLAIDLADATQVVVLADHDSKVLARRTVRCSAWQLGQVLEWGLAAARAHGFAGVVVACEPTGHRWRVMAEHAAARGLELVCVQPLLVRRAREAEDFTRDKSDAKDAMLIARLVGQLHCYLPERPTQAWARLRHLGARRVEQTTMTSACQQRLRDLLECAWPAVLTRPWPPGRWTAGPGGPPWPWPAVTPPASAHWAGPGSPGRSTGSCPDGAPGDAASGSCGRSGRPPPIPAASPSSGQGPWSGPPSSWPTSTTRWASSSRSRPA